MLWRRCRRSRRRCHLLSVQMHLKLPFGIICCCTQQIESLFSAECFLQNYSVQCENQVRKNCSFCNTVLHKEGVHSVYKCPTNIDDKPMRGAAVKASDCDTGWLWIEPHWRPFLAFFRKKVPCLESGHGKSGKILKKFVKISHHYESSSWVIIMSHHDITMSHHESPWCHHDVTMTSPWVTMTKWVTVENDVERVFCVGEECMRNYLCTCT